MQLILERYRRNVAATSLSLDVNMPLEKCFALLKEMLIPMFLFTLFQTIPVKL